MSRIVLRMAPAAVLLTAFCMSTVKAELRPQPQYVRAPSATLRTPARFVHQNGTRPIQAVSATAPQKMLTTDAPKKAVAGYPYLNAPMYSCPRQNVPVQIGGAAIQHPALKPQEMMHEHTYRAMYPPFFYKVKGSWLWTPFGMESHDCWELQGTMVDVKYRSRFGLLSGFWPPCAR
jgi:hypothetical protein